MRFRLCNSEWEEVRDYGGCKEYLLDDVWYSKTDPTSYPKYVKIFSTDKFNIQAYNTVYTTYCTEVDLHIKIKETLNFVEALMGFTPSIIEVQKFVPVSSWYMKPSNDTVVCITASKEWVKTPHHASLFMWLLRVSPLFEGTIQSIYDKRDKINTYDFAFLDPKVQEFVERILAGEEFDNPYERYTTSTNVHNYAGIITQSQKQKVNEGRISATGVS